MRSEFDDIRAHITAEPPRPSELLELAHALLDDLEQLRSRESAVRARYLALLTAAHTTVAADTAGHPAPLTFLRRELAEQGQLPDGEQRVVPDAAAAQVMRAPFDEPAAPRRSRAVRGSFCGGVSRSLRG
ncbi:hypothetical protein GCM10010116_51290 [Microbispora rosea subsp. aerata]|nr:hypothetical protein [Microbispora rosea]GGO25565.1 hypothetical protein GCM10010116_51290 [Microbispora rosea subsp. aerata]GIH56873.1 hypothetical protein Mro02_37870 [Microbispora rosea subsp. aerata]GLJ82799.1 hypothetical protein GCM10017588_15250 [Microbispora rosea subsp. aerata]